jgi:pimeloyl-ACP methyl ester carboxylesterase
LENTRQKTWDPGRWREFLAGVPAVCGIVVDPSKVHELLYGDSDAATVEAIAGRLRPMGTGVGPMEPPEPAWKTVPSTFVVCTEDGALPVSARREMAAHADEVLEWPTDHSPFLTRPSELATLLVSYL